MSTDPRGMMTKKLVFGITESSAGDGGAFFFAYLESYCSAEAKSAAPGKMVNKSC